MRPDKSPRIGTTPARILAPSDLWRSPGPVDAAVASALDLVVGGRVLSVSADRRKLVLGDAFATVEVELGAAEVVAAGDLAVIAGELHSARLSGARVVQRICPSRPPDQHRETARFVYGDVGRALAARAAAVRALRAYFDEQRFVEVDTPAMVPSPGLDVHLDAFEIPEGPLSTPAYLSTSPEYQMKRLLAGGVPRCFQIAHCYRRGERGPRHNPEFSMLEWYRAFADVADVMEDTEQIVGAVAAAVGIGGIIEVAEMHIDLAAPFERVPVAEAFARWAGVPADDAIELASRDETAFFRALVDSVEPALARMGRPVFLVDWPAPLASLARLSPRDPRVCERFELYVGGVELCNGFGELTDPKDQRARLEHDQAERKRRGLPVYPIDERFVAALEEGMPPAAGNALGIDRLVAVCLGAVELQAVQAFPIGVL
jgi:lysyl-tRNA synthetase class 2